MSNNTIQGKIIDTAKQPLIGASVFVSDHTGKEITNAQGYMIGAATDTQGIYNIQAAPPTAKFLTARYMGYRTTTFPVGTEVMMLREEVNTLAEATVTASRPQPQVKDNKMLYILLAIAAAGALIALLLYINKKGSPAVATVKTAR